MFTAATLGLILVSSCRPTPQAGAPAFLTSSEAQGSVVAQAADCKGCKLRPRTFYLVRVEQLQRVRGKSSLRYLGSNAEHHFFRAWNKLLEPPQVDHVAIPLAQCAVSEPHSPDEEQALPRYRKLDLSGAGCAVH